MLIQKKYPKKSLTGTDMASNSSYQNMGSASGYEKGTML